jgi:membrane protein DedA with SNARE-associated domain/rhodanese-related sulfurtransferase
VEFIADAIARHGYSLLFFVVLAEAIGLPVPASVALLVAGGASAKGPLHTRETLAAAYAAMLMADNLLFLLGRLTGWWLLGMLCRVSLNPEACITRSAHSFYKRGRIVLIFAKFLPGISTMAAPLAGSMSLPYAQFFALDLAGASLYILTYFGAGYLFRDFLTGMLHGYSAAGSVIGWLVGLLVAGWVIRRIWLWRQSRREAPVPMLSPEEVAVRDNVAIYDVRSHGYYDQGTMRIKGSVRMEPSAISELYPAMPSGREIVLYCTCVREATAVKVARELANKGIPTAVLEGGLSAWKKASLPLEPVPVDEVVMLPKFA